MLELLKWFRNKLLSDVTITSYVRNRVYLAFKPTVVAHFKNYPQITLESSEGSNYDFLNVYKAELTVHIWTEGSGGQTTAKKILRRILELVDTQRFDKETSNPVVYRFDRLGSVVVYEEEHEGYHAVLRFLVLVEGYVK